MQITKSLTVSTSGFLTVTVSNPPKEYVGRAITITVTVTGGLGATEKLVKITWGDGTAIQQFSELFPGPYTYQHTYSSPSASYPISVNVEDPATGASGSGSSTIQIANVLSATFTVDKSSGPIPLSVIFSYTISNGYSPYSWTLKPEGPAGTTYTGTTASGTKGHTYNTVGSFTAVLTVTDALGAQSVYRILAVIGNPVENLKLWWSSLNTTQKVATGVTAITGIVGAFLIIKRIRR